MQQVGIDAERRFTAFVARDRNLVLLGIGDQLGARSQIPFSPWGDDPDIGLLRVIGEFETNLIIALAGGTVRNSVSTHFAGNFDLAFGNQWPCDRGAKKIHALIERVGAEHREDIVAHKFFAQIFDENLLDAQHLSFRARRFNLFTLADIGGEGYNFGIVLILQPAQNDRGVEPARIGENDFFDVILFHGRCDSRSCGPPQRRFFDRSFSAAAKQKCLFPALRCLLSGWTFM